MNGEWTSIGRIVFQEGNLSLPVVRAVPGLYRLTFDSGAVYIGEASDLQRRLGDYLIYYPSVGIESEFRLHKRLINERGANVEILVGEEFTTRSSRCKREHQEIKAAKRLSELQHFRVLNGGTLEERITFHQSEIERLQAKLSRNFGERDLDELMHEELLKNASANSMSDELARRTAVEMGLSDGEIDELFAKVNRNTDANTQGNKVVGNEGNNHGE